MKIPMVKFFEKKEVDIYDWHDKFLWWPKFFDNMMIWLETIERRVVIDSEGNWAGGFESHVEYRVKK